MGTEESIIYAYDLATIPSVLPAFANAKDLIVCDEARAPRASALAQPPGAAASLRRAAVPAMGSAAANPARRCTDRMRSADPARPVVRRACATRSRTAATCRAPRRGALPSPAHCMSCASPQCWPASPLFRHGLPSCVTPPAQLWQGPGHATMCARKLNSKSLTHACLFREPSPRAWAQQSWSERRTVVVVQSRLRSAAPRAGTLLQAQRHGRPGARAAGGGRRGPAPAVRRPGLSPC